MKRRPGANRRGARLPTSAPVSGGGGGGGVVTSGLVFNLDASDAASYPGTGLTWTDTINGDTVAFPTAPGYRSDPGFLNFAGGNEASGSISAAPITQGAIEVWFRWKTTTGGVKGTLLSNGGSPSAWYHLGQASTGEAFEFFNNGSGFNYLAMDYKDPSTTLLRDGAWHQLVVVVDGNGNSGAPAGNNAIYLDGNAIAPIGGGGSSGLFFRHGSAASNTLWNAAGIMLGNLNGLYDFNSDIAIVRMYDRPGGTFSAAEVAQNYAADSPRFQTFSPDSISSLTLWLDPDDTNTITTGFGGAVTTIQDKAFMVPQAGGASAAGPTLATIDGRQWLNFNGSTQYLGVQTASGSSVRLMDIASQSQYEYYVVVRPRAATSNISNAYENQNIFGCSNGYWGLSSRQSAGPVGDPTSLRVHSWTQNKTGSPASVAVDSKAVIGASQKSGSMHPYKNGVQGAAVAGSGPAQVNHEIQLGKNNYSGPYYDGYVGEVLVFNDALDATQRSDLYAYLQAKWGTP